MSINKVAFLFPGQGSQYVGMGAELASNFSSAREVFAELDDVLSEGLSAEIFSGSETNLRATRNAQPALLAVSVAVMRVLQKDFSVDFSTNFSANFTESNLVMAGHSLGEYSALTTAGVLSYRDSVRLLRLRGDAMQAAVADGEGLMAAILGLDIEAVQMVAAEASSSESSSSETSSNEASSGICVVANDNAKGQVVVSGDKAAVERAIELAKERGAKRAISLDVSAPFHSPLMLAAAAAMRSALAEVNFADASCPLYPNVTASAERSGARFRELLVEQVCKRVRWRETLLALEEAGVSKAYELGAGRALSGMVKRTTPEMNCTAVLSLASLEQTAKELS